MRPIILTVTQYKSENEPPTTKFFVLDTAATCTIVNALELLTDPESCFETMALGGKYDEVATYEGCLTLRAGKFSALFPGAYYLPDFPYNLISMAQLDRAGFEYKIRHGNVRIRRTRGSQWFLFATLAGNNLYTFRYTPGIAINPYQDTSKPSRLVPEIHVVKNFGNATNHVPSLAILNGIRDGMYYHIMSDHMSVEPMIARVRAGTLKNDLTKKIIAAIKERYTSKLAHAVRLPRNHQHLAAGRILERVHCDTLGPFTNAHDDDRKTYFTTVIDEYSGYTSFTYTIGKGGIRKEVLNILKMWNTKFQDRIAYFRSDNAAELPTREELAELGIDKPEIPGYTPQKNGTAERENRTILQYIGKIVMNFAKKNYFLLLGYIMRHAFYLMNHTPVQRKQWRTPASLFFKLDKERVYPFASFGLDVIVAVSKVEARALRISVDKSIPNKLLGTFLGYGDDTDSSIIMFSSPSMPVRLSCNVTFRGGRESLMKYFDYHESLPSGKNHAEWNPSGMLQQAFEFPTDNRNTFESASIEELDDAPASRNRKRSLLDDAGGGEEVPGEDDNVIMDQLAAPLQSTNVYQHPENPYYHTLGTIMIDTYSKEDLRDQLLAQHPEILQDFHARFPTLELLGLPPHPGSEDVSSGHEIDSTKLGAGDDQPISEFPSLGVILAGEGHNRDITKMPAGAPDPAEPLHNLLDPFERNDLQVNETSFNPGKESSSDVRGGDFAEEMLPPNDPEVAYTSGESEDSDTDNVDYAPIPTNATLPQLPFPDSSYDSQQDSDTDEIPVEGDTSNADTKSAADNSHHYQLKNRDVFTDKMVLDSDSSEDECDDSEYDSTDDGDDEAHSEATSAQSRLLDSIVELDNLLELMESSGERSRVERGQLDTTSAKMFGISGLETQNEGPTQPMVPLARMESS